MKKTKNKVWAAEIQEALGEILRTGTHGLISRETQIKLYRISLEIDPPPDPEET